MFCLIYRLLLFSNRILINESGFLSPSFCAVMKREPEFSFVISIHSRDSHKTTQHVDQLLGVDRHCQTFPPCRKTLMETDVTERLLLKMNATSNCSEKHFIVRKHEKDVVIRSKHLKIAKTSFLCRGGFQSEVTTMFTSCFFFFLTMQRCSDVTMLESFFRR